MIDKNEINYKEKEKNNINYNNFNLKLSEGNFNFLKEKDQKIYPPKQVLELNLKKEILKIIILIIMLN